MKERTNKKMGRIERKVGEDGSRFCDEGSKKVNSIIRVTSCMR